MRELMTYHWPGNVRELENAIARMAVMAEGGHIEKFEQYTNQKRNVHTISEEGRPSLMDSADGKSLDERLAEFEKRLIIESLRECGGIQSRAAKLLGINQRSLWHRTKKYNIDVQNIKKQQSV